MPSFLDELKAERDHVLAQSEKTLPVPGTQGRKAVKFVPPQDRDKLTPVIAAYKARGALSAEQERQLIIDCHAEVLTRNEDGELVAPEGGKLRFDASDERWGVGENGTARECVAKLYNLDLIPLAAAGHVDFIVDWLQGLEADIAARVEGKSGSDEES